MTFTGLCHRLRYCQPNKVDFNFFFYFVIHSLFAVYCIFLLKTDKVYSLLIRILWFMSEAVIGVNKKN